MTLSLIMCDIDFFKADNDNYGHLAGDLGWQQVAGRSVAQSDKLLIKSLASYVTLSLGVASMIPTSESRPEERVWSKPVGRRPNPKGPGYTFHTRLRGLYTCILDATGYQLLLTTPSD